jgi:hypothetical protein
VLAVGDQIEHSELRFLVGVVAASLEEAFGPFDWVECFEVGTDPFDCVEGFEEGIVQGGYLLVAESPWQSVGELQVKHLYSHPCSYHVAGERLHQRRLRSCDHLILLVHSVQLNWGW